MATKRKQESKISINAEKGWFVIKIEAPLKLILAIIAAIATVYGYPTLLELALKLLAIK